MAFIWRPSIYKNSAWTILPRPIIKFSFPTTWKFDKQTVPLKDGCITYGHAIDSDQIVIQGFIGNVDGTHKISEEEMFGVLESLRTALDVGSRSDLYELFIYYDEDEDTYRKLKNVVTVGFDVDMGDADRVIWPYSIVMEAEDRVIYTTGPNL